MFYRAANAHDEGVALPPNETVRRRVGVALYGVHRRTSACGWQRDQGPMGGSGTDPSPAGRRPTIGVQ